MTRTPSWPYLFAAPLSLAVLARPIENPDVFWHLSAGRWMFEHASVPTSDFLTSTRGGSPWVDFEWLTQLLYSGAHALGGFPALFALKIVVLGAALALVAYALHRQGQDAAGCAVGLIVAALGLVPSADVRPENFSLLFFAFQLAWLEEERRVPELGGPGRLLAAAAFYALWANLHGGFVFGLALVGAYAVGDLTKLRPWAAFGLAGLAGAMLNPYGPGLYGAILSHAKAAPELAQTIVEWRPVTVENAWTWPFWVLLALSAPAAAWARRAGRAIPRAHLLAMSGLALACAQTRNTPYFCLASAVYLPRLAGKLDARGLAATAGFAVYFLAAYVWPATLRKEPWKPEGFPARAADFLTAESGTLSGKKLFHPYGWGGYLGWRLAASDYLAFWDGRYLFQDMLEEEHKSKESPKTWQAYLDKHGIEVAVVEHTNLMFAAGAEKNAIPRPFYVYFMPQNRWALVDWDPRALVFARRDAVPAAWLEQNEFRHMRPGDEAWVRSQIQSGALRKEDLRHDMERIFASPDLAPKPL